MHLLINWLWQAAALVLIVHLLLASWRGLSAATRYGVWSITLGLIVLLPFRSLLDVVAVAPAASPIESPAAESVVFAIPQVPAWLIGVFICLWIEWAAFSAVRLARAVGALADARRTCTPFPPEREARLSKWLEMRDRGRRASLAFSRRVRGAAVLGLRAPIIAISPALAARLSDDELDQIVVHELAHVRRHDDLSTFLQAAIDVVAGFHPAVRVVQTRLALEREMACDDWVVRLTGSAKRYAACLTRVAEAQDPVIDLLAPAALAPSQLTARVMRLLDGRRSRARASHLGLVAATPILCLLAVFLTEFGVVSAVETEIATELRLQPAGSREPRAGAPSNRAQRAIQRAQPRAARAAAQPIAALRAAAPDAEESTVSSIAARPSHSVTRGAASVHTVAGTAPAAVSPIEAEPLAVLDPFPHVADAVQEAAVAEGESPLVTLSSPWLVTADAGAALGQGTGRAAVAVGQGAERAAIATAGFFTRMGKSIARAF